MLDYGIIGKKGSGKSHLCEYLKTNANLTKNESMKNTLIERVKMADPLKDMVRSCLYRLNYNYKTIERMIEGDLKEEIIDELGVSPRHMMQTLGTEWGRNCVSEAMWGNMFTHLAKTHQNTGNYVICDDVRFDNETAVAKKCGLNLIKILNPNDTSSDTHASEVEPSNWEVDAIWLNDRETALTLDMNNFEQMLKHKGVLNNTVAVIYNNEIHDVAICRDRFYTYEEIVELIEEQAQANLQLLEEGFPVHELERTR